MCVEELIVGALPHIIVYTPGPTSTSHNTHQTSTYACPWKRLQSTTSSLKYYDERTYLATHNGVHGYSLFLALAVALLPLSATLVMATSPPTTPPAEPPRDPDLWRFEDTGATCE
jgi:hypothetical protein